MAKNNSDKYLTRAKLKKQIESDRGWYFITFVRELPSNRLYGFSLYNEFFVLFRDKNDNLVCYLLSSLERKSDRLEIPFFEVIKKQGEIWFYRGI